VFRRYRIRVTDTLDAVSSWVTSNIVTVNRLPPAPTVEAPVNGAATYNRQPRFLVRLGAEPDGEDQMLSVQDVFGVWKDSVNHPGFFSRPGWLGDHAAVIFRHELVPIGNYTTSIKAKDRTFMEDSGAVSRGFAVLDFPLEDIVPNETPVKADHILVLRSAVNNIRHYYGLAAVAWQEAVIPGRTQILHWTSHVLELRRAIDEIIAFINSFDSSPAFAVPIPLWIAIEPGRPRAAIMAQFCAVIPTL
jgi:hypothetical protein